jgi:DNA modification methylase
MIVQADAGRLPLPDQSVDLVIGSPPYLDARTYGIDAQRDLNRWASWMIEVTHEALRVSRGLAIWVCAGVTRNRTYQPGPEALLSDWIRGGGSAYRPCYWHRVGIPGSGGDQWFRADVEIVLAFKRTGSLPYANPTANGQPPKWQPGGKPSHRMPNGRRVQKMHSKNTSNGTKQTQGYNPPEIANPGNLLRVDVGGGRLGSKHAHENEAPYPVGVPAWFIASHCPPGGTVLDPFGGSGTTAQAAKQIGRRWIICDLRQTQCELSQRRLSNITSGFQFTEATA